MKNVIYSPYAAKAIAEGRKRHMRFRVRGQGEIPLDPFYEDEWWYEILKSETIIPLNVKGRVDVLKEAGIPIKGLVIAHEAPRLLKAPQVEKEPFEEPDMPNCLLIFQGL